MLFWVLVLVPPLLVFAFAVTAAHQLLRVPPGDRIRVGLAIAALLVFALGTVTYMETTLRHIARDAAEPIHGLIGRPVPYTGGDHAYDHDYTRHGREYEARAFEHPFYVGTATLLLAAIGFSFGVGTNARTAIWSFAISCVGAMFIFWVVREFRAWDIFI